MIRWITIALAVVGLLVGIYAVATAREEQARPPLARTPSVNPFAAGVAALGIVEPSGRDVAIVAPEQKLVTRVHVDVGQTVKEGDPLFELENRQLQADLVRARAAVAIAQGEVDRWHALPRKEDLPPLEAAVARVRVIVADAEDRLRLQEQAMERGANNERDVTAARYSRDAARAELDRASGELEKARAGGWEPDLAIATAHLNQRRAEVEALTLLLERLIVRSPRAGQVLRRNVEAGEMASIDPVRPAMILGDLTKLNIRAQVDEEDIALVREGATAVARTRGSVVREVPLKLVRIEPFARGKVDLAGTNTERVDTRVIDVLFEVVKAPEMVLYPGQAVDVYIERRE